MRELQEEDLEGDKETKELGDEGTGDKGGEPLITKEFCKKVLVLA